MKRKSREILEFEKEFYTICQKDVIPILSQYEPERRKMLKELIRIVSIRAIIIIGAIILFKDGLWFIITQGDDIFIMICIVIFCILVFPIWDYNNKFVQKLKSSIMPKIIPVFGHMQWINGLTLIDAKELKASQLFGYWDKRESFDSFRGNYKGVDFSISETRLYISGRKTDDTIFKGVIVTFNSNKTIKNTTIISTKGDRSLRNNDSMNIGTILNIVVSFAAASFLAILIQSRGYFGGDSLKCLMATLCLSVLVVVLLNVIFRAVKSNTHNEVRLEDPEFSRRYNVYSSDQVEARYLVTPAFMERFNNIETAFGTKKVKCSFYNESIMFAISTRKNLFEVGNLFCSLSNPNQMKSFFNELSSILALVDYFKLNEHTKL